MNDPQENLDYELVHMDLKVTEDRKTRDATLEEKEFWLECRER